MVRGSNVRSENEAIRDGVSQDGSERAQSPDIPSSMLIMDEPPSPFAIRYNCRNTAVVHRFSPVPNLSQDDLSLNFCLI